MQESKVAGRPSMAWVPVVSADGRTHMEARWQEAVAPAATVPTPHAA